MTHVSNAASYRILQAEGLELLDGLEPHRAHVVHGIYQHEPEADTDVSAEVAAERQIRGSRLVRMKCSKVEGTAHNETYSWHTTNIKSYATRTSLRTTRPVP